MSNAVVLFDRVDKESDDFKKFQSIKKFLKDSKFYYKDLIQVNSLFDYANNSEEYLKLEVLSAIEFIKKSDIILTDASSNKRSLFYTGVCLAVHAFIKPINILIFKSEKTEESISKELSNIDESFKDVFTSNNVDVADGSPVCEILEGYYTAKKNLLVIIEFLIFENERF